jgi:hypothetical protein
MIADLDETIRELLIAEIPIANGEIEISFDQPIRDWSAKLSRPTINLFLYDVRENPTLRQHQWQQVANGRSQDHLARQKRTPFRVDCLYMLTTWAKEPADEHRLLTRTMLALFRHPTLPEEHPTKKGEKLLVGSLRNPPFEIQARLASHDRLTNPAEVWGALENDLRPSVSYIVTLALDPWQEVEGPIVETLILRPGPATGLPNAPRLVSDDPDQDNIFIGGTVRHKATGESLKKVKVEIKGLGLFSETDERGRFKLGPVTYGAHTLVASPTAETAPESSTTIPSQEKEITVYNARLDKKRGDYDVEL